MIKQAKNILPALEAGEAIYKHLEKELQDFSGGLSCEDYTSYHALTEHKCDSCGVFLTEEEYLDYEDVCFSCLHFETSGLLLDDPSRELE